MEKESLEQGDDFVRQSSASIEPCGDTCVAALDVLRATRLCIEQFDGRNATIENIQIG
jgi:hypothetical protein